MKRFWILKGLKFALFLAAGIAALGYVVMSLWNWLLPPLAGWHALGFGQALALLVLCRILFGGLRGHGGGHWRQRLRERWEQMTPEERERLRAGLGHRCGRDQSASPPPA
jgi:hypothetical protein